MRYFLAVLLLVGSVYFAYQAGKSNAEAEATIVNCRNAATLGDEIDKAERKTTEAKREAEAAKREAQASAMERDWAKNEKLEAERKQQQAELARQSAEYEKQNAERKARLGGY